MNPASTDVDDTEVTVPAGGFFCLTLKSLNLRIEARWVVVLNDASPPMGLCWKPTN